MGLTRKLAFVSTITTMCLSSLQNAPLNFEDTEATPTPMNVSSSQLGKASFHGENLPESYTVLLEGNSYKNEELVLSSSVFSEVFGEMRQLTAEELLEQRNTISNISKETGVNFFDLC